MSARALFNLFRETWAEWSQDKVPRLGAALAYYTVFSLAPLLIIAIAIAGMVFGQEAAKGQIVWQIRGLVRQQGAELIQTIIENASLPSTSVPATLIGVVVLLVGALGAFSQLQDAFDTIWEVTPKPGSGLKMILENRLISFAMVVGVGFLLLVSLVVNAALAAFGNYLGGLFPNFNVVLVTLNFIIPLVVVTLLFALMFKFLPDVKIAWRDVWPGAVLTALLFSFGKFLIGLYLGNSNIGSAYGAAGSLIIILVWIYCSAQILFFGAEFTRVYVKYYGSRRVVPTENALPLTEEQRAQQGIPRAETVRALALARERMLAVPLPLRRRPRRRDHRYASALLTFAAGVSAGVVVALRALQDHPHSRAQAWRKPG